MRFEKKCLGAIGMGSSIAIAWLVCSLALSDDACRGSEAGQLQVLREYDPGVMCGSFSSDGRLVATGASDNSLAVWDVASGRRLAKFGTDGPVELVAFAQDGAMVLGAGATTAASAHKVHYGVWKTATNKRLLDVSALAGEGPFAFSPDGTRAIDGSYVTLRDLRTGRAIRNYVQGTTFDSADPTGQDGILQANDACFSVDGTLIAAGGSQNKQRSA